MATTYFAVFASANTPTWARADTANGRNGWSATGYAASGNDATPPTTTTANDEPGTTLSGLTAGTAYKLWAIWDDGATSSNGPIASAEFTTFDLYTTTGDLAAQAAALAGTAVRTRIHATTGALSADAGAVAGTSVHYTLHATTGALSAQAATVSGAALHPHTTTGALSAQASTVAGTAAHEHATTGALSAQAASVSGSAALTTAGSFGSTGALSADVAAVAGTAVHLTLHTTTGALSAATAAVAGTSVHYTLHTSTGALSAAEAAIGGDAAHSGVVTHTTTGDLSAGPASVSGNAQRNGVFADATRTGAPGPRRRTSYVAFINGKRFIGSLEEIQSVIDEFTKEQIETAEKTLKPPKKARIVVQAGKPTNKTEKVPEPQETLQVQAEVRDYYAEAYEEALRVIRKAIESAKLAEDEDEETLMLFL